MDPNTTKQGVGGQTGGQGQSGQQAHVNVPVLTITTTLKGLAKRETTAGDKSHLYEIVESIGNAIATTSPGFNVQEFVLACGVNPSWAAAAA